MAEINVDVGDIRAMAGTFRRLAPAMAERVIVRTINKTGDRVNSRLVRHVSSETGMTQQRVRSVVKRRLATVASVAFVLTVRDSFTSLGAFRPTQRKTGVSAAPWKKRRIYAGTFIGFPGTGRAQVFKRTGKKRLPIKKLYGPAVPKEIVSPKAEVLTRQLVRDVAPKILEHEVSFELSRAKKGGGSKSGRARYARPGPPPGVHAMDALKAALRADPRSGYRG